MLASVRDIRLVTTKVLSTIVLKTVAEILSTWHLCGVGDVHEILNHVFHILHCLVMTALLVFVCLCVVPVETMPVTDRSQCHGKTGPQGFVVHFNSYFQTAGNFFGE